MLIIILDQNTALKEEKNNMSGITFPLSFPTEEEMLVVLKKTIEKSWRTDLDIDDINEWLRNFTGKVYPIEAERRLGLWLLCNFTYYNEDEVNYLCHVLFQKLVHRLLIDNRLESEEDAERCIQNTAFTSIGEASESGGLLLYHLRQEAKLDLDRFIFPTGIGTTACDNIVCIDDAMISGGTASRFFYNHKSEIADKTIYYISLITTDIAIEKMRDQGITVISCIKLDDRNRMFSEKSLAFFKYPSLLPCAKKMAEEYGKAIEPQKPLGYKDGQYAFGFYYNIPNNSLPIFWSTDNWNPILPRKEKYQNAKQARRQYGFYI